MIPGWIDGSENRDRVKTNKTSVLTEVHVETGVKNVVTLYDKPKCDGSESKATAFFGTDTYYALTPEVDSYFYYLKEFKSISITKNTSMYKNSRESYMTYEDMPLCISFASDAHNWQLSQETKMNHFEMFDESYE